MNIGYARVSTRDQNLELQLDALNKAGCETIFQEKASGATKARPELDRMLARAYASKLAECHCCFWRRFTTIGSSQVLEPNGPAQARKEG